MYIYISNLSGSFFTPNSCFNFTLMMDYHQLQHADRGNELQHSCFPGAVIE
jgi:hypothetical protein